VQITRGSAVPNIPTREGPGGRNTSGVLEHEQPGDQACSGGRVGGLGVIRGVSSVTQAHGAVWQARKAWVPDCSCWEPRPGGGTFSSGPALACRGSVRPVLPCDRGHDKKDLISRSSAIRTGHRARWLIAAGFLRGLGRAAVSWFERQGRPVGQVQRVLRESLTPLGVRLAPWVLAQLAADISAGRAVELA